MNQALSAESVSLSLGGRLVLDRITATFRTGELVAIVGPNGAGKSSLLSCMAGLRRPAQGQIKLEKAVVTDIPARRRAKALAFLAQTPEIAWDVDVRTFIGLGRTPHLGAFGPGADDIAAIEQAITTTGLDDFAARAITRLSGGERARALIARALAGQTDWLLADEPLTGLDPGHALDTVGLFQRLAHEQRKGVVVTLHDLTLAARFADRVLLLDKGFLVADGPPRQALTPQALAKAYGVRTRTHAGAAGPLIEILRRVD
ncbi:ABC transporter ATP-binding protein [Caulobacter segnis]|uniref:ABC transporter n=1 Tax=Caulobacter segnis TaxID=88688 RepID=A0A2W5VKN1_9CAUL|nr:ABC transporter ATP-binding protein [Caulobacter segnis]PZR35885.1 MAG: ABC transporter [Caulobacter segnis]